MQQRRLGRTARVVGAIGAGMGGLAWKGVDPHDARRALVRALEHGVDLVDAIGGADVEAMVAAAITELRARDRVTVATRVIPAAHAGPVDPLARVYPTGALRDQIEATLRLTRFEVVPVALLHRWHDAWLDDNAWPELRGTLERLVREGKVLHWGIAVGAGGPDDAARALGEAIVEVVEVPYNLFDRRAEATLLPAAKAHDAGVIVRSPLDAGALGGELLPAAGPAGARFHRDDWRARYFAGDRLAEIAVRVARLCEHVADPPPAAGGTEAARQALEGALARRRGTAVEARTTAELALRFCLSRPEPSAVVVGMRTREHVDADLAAGDGRALSAAVLERLAEHAWDKRWD